ncbi:DUF4468 domain-containing protein [Danxiaibacter flavus]|uniref:DUF4468 domain-containing protein n=1 Tax=Danxiaibacter flavus TaxID=3049108 RepID=A0ABV3ZP16_9BACT|nr:DUF4468 domain-containing protein [Chitinophagaceae bacterium DXS]
MKHLLSIAICLLPLVSNAQSGGLNYKVEDRYLYYGEVVQVDTSLTTGDLYKNSKLFIVKLALPNIQTTTDDATGATVAVSVEEPATYKTQTGIGSIPMKLKYNIKIEMKNGRYRYTFDNIMINYEEDNKSVDHPLYDVDKGKGGGILGTGERKRVLKAMDALFLRKIELLKNTMKTKSDGF